MIRELRADFGRYSQSWLRLLMMPHIWVLIWFRFGHWLYRENPALIFRLLKPFYSIGYIFIEAFMQMRLDPNAQVGPGLFMTHSGGITLHPDVVIGANCSLAHHVTIGQRGVGWKGVPKIGDGVYIGTGAVIVGPITIGDRAKIAANTLVVTSVPAGATVIGVPGRIGRVPKPNEMLMDVQDALDEAKP